MLSNHKTPDPCPLRIGFDISQTGKHKAGCGYFAHELIQVLLNNGSEHQYTLYPSFGDFYLDPTMPLHNPYHSGKYGSRQTTKTSAKLFWHDTQLEKRLGHPDLIHANNFWCPIQLKKTKLIYTLYDLGFMLNPSWTTEANRLGCFEGVFRASLSADWIVTISHSSRKHFLETFPYFPEDRIEVIYPHSRYTDTTTKLALPEYLQHLKPHSYWLSVGTIEPRKNQKRLAEAYARYLALGGKPMPLVFAGMNGWLMDDFQTHLKNLNIEEHVILTGYLSDETLAWLYRHCYANLYPSLFEGFGLPVLEGMQFGAPTIASNTSSIPEITGDAALLLAPEQTEIWTQTMLSLSQSTAMRTALSESAKKQAALFTQKQPTAKKLVELYQVAHASPKRSHMLYD